MKGKFVKGEVIKLAIDTFELEIFKLDRENNTDGITKEDINQNINWMYEYRDAKEYLEKDYIEKYKK